MQTLPTTTSTYMLHSVTDLMTWQGENNLTGTELTGGPLAASGQHIKTLGGGRYRIIELAGRGGMSQVYHAYDTHHDRDVAIKVLLLELSGEDSFLVRFRRESELMRDLNHPNILRAYDFGQENNKFYLVMSYFGGGTLRTRINQGQLTLAQIAAYLEQIAAGLGYAHSRHIVHRDIKPSNILIHHASEQAVISDFGIARALSNTNPNRTGTIMGTPLYMAPEQFLDRVDQRSDIYSLGIVLFQMLSGDVPFKGEGIGFKHLNETVPPLPGGYGPGIEQVVRKALAKRPEARFQSVEELARAFREAVQAFASGQTSRVYGVGINPQPADQSAKAEEISPSLLDSQSLLSELPVITPSQLQPEQAGPGAAFSFYNQATSFTLEPAALSYLDLNDIPAEPVAKPSIQKRAVSDQVPAASSGQRAYLPYDQTQAGVPLIAPARSLQPVGVGPAPGQARWLVAGLLLLAALLVGLALVGFNLPGFLSPSAVSLTPPTTGAATAPVALPSASPVPAPTALAGVVGSTSTPAASVASPAPTLVPARPGFDFVFTSYTPGTKSSNIWRYNTRSGTLSQLTFNNGDSLASWSADGSYIVYQRIRGTTYDLFRIPPDGSTPLFLKSDAMNPELSPAGNDILYIDLTNNELYRGVVENGGITRTTRLTDTRGKQKRGPVWSADAKQAAFAMTDERGIFQIFLLDLSRPDSLPLQLTSFSSENALWPCFSPDGKQIVFSTNDNHSDPAQRLPLDIWVVNLTVLDVRRLTQPGEGHNSHPLWVVDETSGSGSRIYFNSDRVTKTGQEQWARIWVMNPDGSNPQLFIPHLSGDVQARQDDFGPDVTVRKS